MGFTGRKYSINENYFSKIDNENKSYWLGYLYGDGSVDNSRHQLGLSSKDKEQLEKFRNDISSNHKITCRTINNKQYYMFNVYSKKLCDNLINLGCVPNKSLKDLHIPSMRENLIKHFIRGLFDADGSLWKINQKHAVNRIGFCITGSKTLLRDILNYLVLNDVVDYSNKIMTDGNVWRINYNYTQAEKFCEYIYENSNVYLDRKYNKFYLLVGDRINA